MENQRLDRIFLRQTDSSFTFPFHLIQGPMKKLPLLLILLAAALLLSACNATTVEVAACASTPEPAGFWLGLWHGFIAPFAFLVSLFDDAVAVYEVCNNGGWYDFGFLFGASIILGGSGGGAGHRRRKRRER